MTVCVSGTSGACALIRPDTPVPDENSERHKCRRQQHGHADVIQRILAREQIQSGIIGGEGKRNDICNEIFHELVVDRKGVLREIIEHIHHVDDIAASLAPEGDCRGDRLDSREDEGREKYRRNPEQHL